MMTLKEWYKINGQDQEMLIDMLGKLENRMIYHHRRSECIMNFSPASIRVNECSDNGKYYETVTFSVVTKIPSDLLVSKVASDNISMLAALGFGLYLGEVNHMINRELIRDQFSSCELFLPERKREYYRHVLVYEKPEYQRDYFSKRGDGQDNTIARSKVKATAAGKAYANEDSLGRVNVIGLSIFVVTTLLMAVIVYILFLIK